MFLFLLVPYKVEELRLIQTIMPP